ncbi:MAG TPA: NADP-dependent malic enzyme [Stellaceae bacterium]|nr:NADP-dependent malic enzyme [Stellaceae bacterium]
MEDGGIRASEDEALQFHASGRPGKLSIAPHKALVTQRDLSLAYSPGVAYPCLRIQKDPSSAFDYTSKGNFVAVISNGTAVLGLGDLGALAAKPVMEGKAALFKRFADIDSIDLEIDTRNVDEFVNCVRFLHPSFGGINLEDIRAPECFVIEERLRELLDIPVFHDDQHGTAIIAAAGLINALHLTGRELGGIRMVVNGAGAASIACVDLLKTMGLPAGNVVLCDTRGVIYRGRSDGMNQWKSAHAVETTARTLEEALEGADVFFGLSVKGAVTQKMVRSMAGKPIVFAMANPDPEITPEEVRAVRSDAIIATGRSDYPNQVNNVLGFPFIFRGALDVRATQINDAMKIAAAEALARLAREDVPDEVAAAYSGQRLLYGPDYIIPAPFDPRLIWAVPSAVAQAAMDSGVARKPIPDMAAYRRSLRGRLDPTAAGLEMIFEKVRANPKRVVFAEGEEEKTVRAALQFADSGYGTPVLVGREERIKTTMSAIGLTSPQGLEIHNARLSHNNKRYTDLLYARQQRRGMLYRDCQRLVNQDRNVFAACMVACGDADAMVTGDTRNSFDVLNEVTRVIDVKPRSVMFGLTVLLARERTVLLADTLVHEQPTPAQLADIAVQAAAKARELGLGPRVALLSYSNFGNPKGQDGERVREAVGMLDRRGADFEYDGEMSADVALDEALMRRLYPFCRLSGAANILVMPELNSANIAAKLLSRLGGGIAVGPLLIGLARPVQIVNTGATVSDLVNLAALAAHDALA